MTKFTVFKTAHRVYTTHSYRNGRGNYGTSRKQVDWVMSADNGVKFSGYDTKRDAIKAGKIRGWEYQK